jgi:thiol-disulfide isomerase/thioredoxin
MLKKLLVIFMVLFVALFALTGCDGVTPPSEGEGEGEGEPTPTTKTVLIETFIADGCASCSVLEPKLEQLAQEYSRDQMILVEAAVWLKYSTQEGYDRYKCYFPNSGGTPQTGFNGLAYKFSGGSISYSSLEAQLNAQLAQEPTIKITASRTSDTTTTTISGTITNLTESTTYQDFVVNGMSFKDRGETGFRYNLTDVFEEGKVSITSLGPGESQSYSITINDINWDGSKLDGVVFVQFPNNNQKVIRQALFVD